MNIIGRDDDILYYTEGTKINSLLINLPSIFPIIRIINSPYSCYLLYSHKYNRTYFGYTINIQRRIRQHNGQLKGGAKYTSRYRPWTIQFQICGFPSSHCALQFEWIIHHSRPRKYDLNSRINIIDKLITSFRQRYNILLYKII